MKKTDEEMKAFIADTVSKVAADYEQRTGRKVLTGNGEDMMRGRISMEVRRWMAIASLHEVSMPDVDMMTTNDKLDFCFKSGVPLPAKYRNMTDDRDTHEIVYGDYKNGRVGD